MAETTGLKIQKLPANPVEGDVQVNAALDLIDAATQQDITINFASDADLTLSTSGTIAQWQYGFIRLTDTGDTLTTGRNVIVPNNKKRSVYWNETAQTLTVKTAAGTGVEIPAGETKELQCDGDNVISADGGGSGGGGSGGASGFLENFTIPVSNEIDALETGTAKVTFRMPYAFVITSIRASVTTAPTDAAIQVDINEGGTSILSTVLSIDSGEKTSVTAATPVVISDVNLDDDAEITIDVDQVGSTIAGAGLKVSITGYKLAQQETIMVAVSDEDTDLTTGTAKLTFRMPYAFTLTGVRGSLTTAATGSNLLTVDINESGTSILSTKLTFDASETTTTTATTPAVISDASLADNAEITIDIDQIGETTPGAGLKIYLIGSQ